MKSKNEIYRLIHKAQLAGWRVERSKHWRLYPPDKRFPPITCSMTPSDNYAVDNIKKDLRKAGLKI